MTLPEPREVGPLQSREEARVAREHRSRYQQKLLELEAQYGGKRTLSANFVSDLVDLARAREVELDVEYMAYISGVLDYVENRRLSAESTAGHLRKELDAFKKPLVVEREQAADGVRTAVARPKYQLPHSDREYTREWMLGELAELIYQFRLAGGVDTTFVKFEAQAASAILPYPELMNVSFSSPTETPVGRQLEPIRATPHWVEVLGAIPFRMYAGMSLFVAVSVVVLAGLSR